MDIHSFWLFNRESITLAIVIAALTGPVFAVTHDLTEQAIKKYRARRCKS